MGFRRDKQFAALNGPYEIEGGGTYPSLTKPVAAHLSEEQIIKVAA